MTGHATRTSAANSDRQLKSVVHWALVRQREPFRQNEKTSEDDPDYIDMQALHCPFYVPLDGEWGADWGCILHPQSEKFGQLVFEHEWCGCHYHEPGLPEQVWA